MLRPLTTLKLSIRLPPGIKCKEIEQTLTPLLTTDTPFGAEVTLSEFEYGDGFMTPIVPEQLSAIYEQASLSVFSKPPIYQGCGGSIPFMTDLGELYPSANFLVTGVGHPTTNAHGPNENLDLEYCKRIISVVSLIVEDYASI